MKPIMTPLVTGKQTHLGLYEQVELARWAAKTVAMIQQYEPNAAVFDVDDVEQIAGGHAPLGFHMRLGCRVQFLEPIDIVVSTAHLIPASEAKVADSAGETYPTGPPNGFQCTFAFGHLAIAVAGGPGFRRDGRWVTGGEQPLMIWPPSPTGITWPPQRPRITSKQELHAFHDALYVQIQNPEVAARLLDGHPEVHYRHKPGEPPPPL